jgi:hypothetical protein
MQKVPKNIKKKEKLAKTMTTEKQKKANRESQKRFREARKNSGMIRGDVWALPEHWPKIRQVEKECQIEAGFLPQEEKVDFIVVNNFRNYREIEISDFLGKCHSRGYNHVIPDGIKAKYNLDQEKDYTIVEEGWWPGSGIVKCALIEVELVVK